MLMAVELKSLGSNINVILKINIFKKIKMYIKYGKKGILADILDEEIKEYTVRVILTNKTIIWTAPTARLCHSVGRLRFIEVVRFLYNFAIDLSDRTKIIYHPKATSMSGGYQALILYM